jgi:predicted 3-demethylubiquinone-9 3-methyltransferase (glyoxalase superfamily)
MRRRDNVQNGIMAKCYFSETLDDPDPKKAERVMKAMLQMKKIDIQGLKQAYEQQ